MIKFFRDLYYRVRAASKLQLIFDLLDLGAKVFIVIFGAKSAIAGLQKTSLIYWNILAILYAAFYGFFLKNKFQANKWINEDIRKTSSIAVAVSQLAAAVHNSRNFRQAEFHHLLQGLLSAIKSEVELLVVDTEGIYINVNLLVEDPQNSNNLQVICRVLPDRPLYASHPKSGMIVWKTMETGTHQYDPSCQIPGKPYKSILAFPLMFVERGQAPVALGVVSIDSARENHFDPSVREKLQIKLLPLLALLNLALLFARHQNQFGGQQNVS